MPTITNVLKFFPKAKEGFTTTLASTISSGATTVPLNSVSGYSNGDTVCLVVEPTSTTAKQVFTGVIDTSGVQVTSVVWTEGTNQSHASGATVVDYATATHISIMSKGLLAEHNIDGTHNDITADSITATTGTFTSLTISGVASAEGWSALGATPNTITNNGNRNYTLVFNSNDLTDTVSAGMRVKLTRTVTAPTKCTSLNGTNQYYSKSSPSAMTFTDDFTVSAWIKVSSYAIGVIASRYNGTSGWIFEMQANGTLLMGGWNASSSNTSQVISNQAVPLNRWVHVAAQLDMSAFTATTTTSYVMIGGVDVASTVVRAGSNPTALIQAGNLEIGGTNGGTNPFPGKLAQVAIFNAKVTQANIRLQMSQTLAGNETSLISAYSFNNSVSDLNANANNLTAQNSAVATTADTPFAGGAPLEYTVGTTDMGVILTTAFSTNTTLNIQVPEGYTIPTSGGLSAISYSTHRIPYGFPTSEAKITLDVYDSTIATNLVTAGYVNPIDGITYLNTGTAAGTMRLTQTGNTKRLMGYTGTMTLSAATQATYTITFPFTFSSIPYAGLTSFGQGTTTLTQAQLNVVATTTGLVPEILATVSSTSGTIQGAWFAEGV